MADEVPTTQSIAAATEGDSTTAAANTTTLPTIAASLASLEATTGTGSGAATPLSTLSDMPPMSAEQRDLSLKVSLADLTARASHHFSQKNYDEAAEVYAQAAEMQAEMNGEMSPDNAEILFLYGRSLFKVGQGKSDVLGGKAPAAADGAAGVRKGKGKKVGKKTANGGKGVVAGSSSKEGEAAAGGVKAEYTSEADKVAQEAGGVKTEKDELEGKKPLFQFTGDENWDDTDEEDADEAEGDEDEDEEEDDLATAFEILDLARVLLSKKLEEKLAANTLDGKGKELEVANGGDRDDAGLRHIRERLADAHDLLVEISLENERYPNAIADARESLKYKLQILPEDSEIIAEAHFKLSLALEFASVTSQSDEEGAAGAPKEVNQELRDEAARELEAAIASTKLKLQNKEVELATLHSPEDNEITRAQIADTKEIIADMEQRLVDLRAPPIDVQAALGGDPMGGILGAALGESAGQTEARIEEAKKTATDLSGLVRKKGKPAASSAAPAAAEEPSPSNATKRKAEDDVEMEDDTSKKPRTEDEAATS